MQAGETIAVAYFSLNELPNELSFGHKKRIKDAIQWRNGVIC